jgi:hypothetical protein
LIDEDFRQWEDQINEGIRQCKKNPASAQDGKDPDAQREFAAA